MAIADFTRVANQLRTLVKDNKQDAMRRVVLQGESIMKRETPIKTGALRRSITSRVERGGNRGVIGTNLSYARPVNDGSKPHIIRPKKAKALFWRGARHPVRVVRHPGTRAAMFVEHTRDKLRPIAERELSSVYGKALGRIK
jgi:phage gpG-like protein